MIRLGLVGCGTMMLAHIREAEGLTEICEYTAMCDICEDRAKTAAEMTGAGFYTTNYKEMVDYVDAVIVALPHDLHYKCGMFFAKHGKHILMEKPLCRTEEECLSLVKTAEENNIKLMCEYPQRYNIGLRKMKELLDSGEYGEIFQMSIWTEQFTDHWYENLRRKVGECTWMTTEGMGGGQLFSHGCHYIDILLWFLGDPVSGAHFGSNKGTPWMEMEGTSNVTMTFKNGTMGYHFGTWGARGSTHEYCFHVHTDKGFFELKERKLVFLKQYDPYNKTEPQKQEWIFDRDKIIHPLVHFAECIRDDKEPFTSGKSAIESLRTIWRLYDSERKNEIADLTDIHLD